MNWINELVEIPRWVGLLQFICLIGLFGIIGIIAVVKNLEIRKLERKKEHE